MIADEIDQPPQIKSKPSKDELLARFKGKRRNYPDQTGKRWAGKRPPAPGVQAIHIQGILYKLIVKAGQKPFMVTKLSSAWGEIEDKRQVLAGIGKPKPVEARNTKSKSKHSQGPVEPVDPVA